nr:sigma-54 dependent transcriptional regulator [Chlorobium phaeovibrioides]
MTQAMQVMETGLNVLILGESGTGKELFAEAIHRGSRRSSGPFVSVNCAAISSSLADSILFGHAKGSFTGAGSDHMGYFEQADQGTIFLDEIGDMGSDIQAKVLRVIQERKIRRVGEKQERKTDFRVISATNRNFNDAIDGQFREDLYYRLEEFPLFLPALRERPEDIPLLCRHFLDEFSSANNLGKITMSDTALSASENHRWPGNIRELKNAVQRAAVTRKDDVIETLEPNIIPGSMKPAYAPPALLPPAAEYGLQPSDSPDTNSYSLEEHEREAILKAYKAALGNLTKTAGILGIGRATLYRKLDKFGLEYLKTG